MSRSSQTVAIIARELGVTIDRCTTGTDLSDLGADSMDMALIAVALEEAFDIDLDKDTEDNWITVGDIVAAVDGVMV